MAFSRIEENSVAGNSEYYYRGDGGVCWTDALLPKYVDKFHVEPSPQFQNFIVGLDIETLSQEIDNFVNTKCTK